MVMMVLSTWIEVMSLEGGSVMENENERERLGVSWEFM